MLKTVEAMIEFTKELKMPVLARINKMTTDGHVFDLNKPIWQLTVGEFLELTGQTPTVAVDNTPREGRRLEYGIGGIARIFNCSMTTANRIKANGKINRAISQHGRQIVIDVDLALELMNVENNNPNKITTL